MDIYTKNHLFFSVASDILTWEGEKGEFRLIDPDDVARFVNT